MGIKVVTLCGSMRFAEEMIKIALDLELTNGYATLQCAYNLNETEHNLMDFDRLDKIHKKKIDISDAIYVVNINGYIGNSTKNEIEYALKNGKEVMYHEPKN